MASVPIVNLPFLYINGMQISNDATTPDEILVVAAGQCRDSTDVYDIVMNNAVAAENTHTGINGLDQGVVANNTLYAVYVVADPVSANPTCIMLSTSMTGPLMPFGYSIFRLIGYIRTDATADFLLAYWSGNNNSRMMMYDAPLATAVTAGAATAYTPVALTNIVPAVQNLPVWVYSDFTPGAASRQLFLTPQGATGDAVKITGAVTAVHVTSNSLVLSRLAAGVPAVSYKVSNAGDAAAINVAGFEFFI